ncbi:MAG: NAD(P)H-dependent glycerol-3-phosphate dehydrogenase [bacterium JZ-2024 1]
MNKPIAVIGGGSWGTVLAFLLSSAGNDVVWWMRREENAEYVRKYRHNPVYHPQCFLPDNVYTTSHFEEIKECPLWFWVVPSAWLEEVAKKIQRAQPEVVISCVKGLVFSSDKSSADTTVQEVLPANPTKKLQEYFPGSEVGVLSGPTISQEILNGQPAAAVVAAYKEEIAREIQKCFPQERLRLYRSGDVVGVELCGAFKNVVAIAAGIARGLQFGSNSLGALVTRGLVEMQRVVTFLGGNAQTVYGLAGLGDLVATCFSSYSRNVKYGEALARSEKPDLGGQVAEGVPSALSFFSLSQRFHLDLPITAEVYAILYRNKPIPEAIASLLQRPLKAESPG